MKPHPQQLKDNHPLFESCENQDLKTLRKYFNTGISVYASSEHKPEPIAWAFSCDSFDFLDLLFEYGYEANHTIGAFGETALFRAIEKDEVKWVDHFLSKGANVNWQDSHGFTPYLKAGGNLSLMEHLEKNGANIYCKTRQDLDALFLTSQADRHEIMDYLLKKGFNVNTRNCNKETPLINAAKGGRLDTIKWLLNHGADINAESMSGKTALDYAKTNNHTKVVELLQQFLNH